MGLCFVLRAVDNQQRLLARVLARVASTPPKSGQIKVVGGDEAFRILVVELAAEHGFALSNDDLRMRVDRLRREQAAINTVTPVTYKVRNELTQADIDEAIARTRGTKQTG